MTINFKAPDIKELKPRILVLGVGGAGGNAINEMIESGVEGVEFIAVNTDAQDLKASRAKQKIQIGLNLTKGLGAGAKLEIGQAAAEELRKHVDTIIVIPNQNLFKIANEKTTFKESFKLSNNVLRYGVQSITDLMVKEGLVNLDFADVETVMSSMGKAMMGTGEAEGEGRAQKATEMALNNPLIDDYSLKGAKGLLINITGGEDLTLFEVDEIVNRIRSEVDHIAEIIIGSITDPSLDGKVRVSIVATALDGQQPESKSVINMVHRIQNRNPGYSDFSTIGTSQSFNFQNNSSNHVTEGATALKAETDAFQDNAPEQEIDDSINVNSDVGAAETLINEQDESLILKNEIEQPKTETNGLENFGLEHDTPDLFENNSFEESSEEIHNTEDENSEEDEFEIPAFLRRQKN